MRKALSACIVSWVLAGVIFVCPSPAADDTIAKVDSYINSQMQRHHIPALSLVILRDGKVLYSRAYGIINAELNVPNTAGAAFLIGSMSKQFAAAATMILVEQKKIALDDPVSKYLTSLPPAWSTVTVRHLLTHTSGIPSYTEVPGFETYNAKEATHDEVIATVRNLPMNFSPGERFHYNNTGYFLLGMLIEKVAGEGYETFLSKHVFTPAGMADTRLNHPAQVISKRVSGYTVSAGKLVNPPFENMSWPYSGGAVLATIEDLAKWDAVLYTDQLLHQSTLQDMWTPMQLSDGSTTQYGFGWHLEQLRNHPLIWHTGHIGGFASFFGRVPDAHLSVILLTNQDELEPDRIGQGVLGLYDSSLAPPAMLDPPTNDPDTTRTGRNLQALRDLAGDNGRSALVMPSLRENTSAGQRKGIQRLLDAMQSFRFLACDPALPANATHLGSSVSTLCYYRLTSAGGVANLTFFLTPDGRLADGLAQLE